MPSVVEAASTLAVFVGVCKIEELGHLRSSDHLVASEMLIVL